MSELERKLWVDTFLEMLRQEGNEDHAARVANGAVKALRAIEAGSPTGVL